nr:hypothetical protein BHI3_32770 [Bacteriovorax sp. HI3]
MLEKLITNFKKSLPEPLRKKLGVAEEDEQVEEQEEEEVEESEAESEASPEEDKKKKQISMIIRVVIILVLGYLALDEFVLKQNSSEPSVEELLAAAPKKPRRPKKVEATQPTEATAPAEGTPPAEGAVATADTNASATEGAPIENINIAPKDESTSSLSSDVPTSNDVVVDSKPVETGVDQKLDQLVNNFESTTETPSTGQMEEVKVPSMGGADAEKQETSMASKIVDDVAVETAPPAYDQIGRGLVYNCKDKYWACVDKPAYVTCNKNMKWNKSKGNSAECVVQAIYGSDDDCAKVQKYNVSTSQATTFCQN